MCRQVYKRAVKAFILAAGFGQRMRPLTEHVPKPLLPVASIPLIGYNLRLLAHHGIKDVIINLHHLGNKIRDALGDGEAYGMKISYSQEEEILGTGGGLKKKHEELQHETFVVLNSDTIMDVNLTEVIARHHKSGALSTLVLRQDPRQQEFGQIEIDEQYRIRKILGHGADDNEDVPLRSCMFVGAHIIEPRLLDYIPQDVESCIMRYAYTKALQNGEYLGSYLMNGYWNDAGTPQRYFQANVDAMTHHMKLHHLDPLSGYELTPRKDLEDAVCMGHNVDIGAGVRIEPPVLLGNDVRLSESASVGPRCVLGNNTHVGKHATLRDVILLDDARVEAEAHLQKVIIGKKSQLAITGD